MWTRSGPELFFISLTIPIGLTALFYPTCDESCSVYGDAWHQTPNGNGPAIADNTTRDARSASLLVVRNDLGDLQVSHAPSLAQITELTTWPMSQFP
jgi:hypothetical protein